MRGKYTKMRDINSNKIYAHDRVMFISQSDIDEEYNVDWSCLWGEIGEVIPDPELEDEWCVRFEKDNSLMPIDTKIDVEYGITWCLVRD